MLLPTMVISWVGFHPSAIGKYNRRFDLSRRDRPVSPEQGVFVLVRDDRESVSSIELDGPGRIRPSTNQNGLSR
jgi:hypothetical protein